MYNVAHTLISFDGFNNNERFKSLLLECFEITHNTECGSTYNFRICISIMISSLSLSIVNNLSNKCYTIHILMNVLLFSSLRFIIQTLFFLASLHISFISSILFLHFKMMANSLKRKFYALAHKESLTRMKAFQRKIDLCCIFRYIIKIGTKKLTRTIKYDVR